MKRFIFIGLLCAASTLLWLPATPSAWADAEYKLRDLDEKETSTWEQNRHDYLESRDEYYEKKREFYDRYKKRIGSNKYRQKAREFYGRQESIYEDEQETGANYEK
ncbi:MAG: hypothetical protein LRY76_07535 [Alphaproteobacteria bacterium]|nr:hypothetical protein [Alphaproteobacteria bacterium]